MAFLLTYEPLEPVEEIVPVTVEIQTAHDAWEEFGALQRRDQKVTRIVAPEGQHITWEELRDLSGERNR